jgi:hypothetical protein
MPTPPVRPNTFILKAGVNRKDAKKQSGKGPRDG